MKKNHLPGAEARGEKLLCGAAAVLFPTAILCYFCAQNIGEFVEIWLIYFMLGVLVVLAALAYCVSLLILRRGFLAMMFCLICWAGCYLEPSLFALFGNAENMPYLYKLLCVALMILAVAVLAVCLLRRLKQDTRKPVILFLAFSALILAFNLLPIVKAGLSRDTSQLGAQLYRTDFYIDEEKTDAPNVYWIHPDGMVGVDMVEKYYHDEQSKFISELETRGFSINESAHFEGEATGQAIPMLTSPYAYDTWISGYIAAPENASQEDGYTVRDKLRDVRRHNEMIAAFGGKGYASSVISVASEVYYAPLSDEAFYNVESVKDEVDICSEAERDKLVLLYNIRDNTEQISGFLKWIFGKIYAMAYLVPASQWLEELMVSTVSTGISQPFSTKMPEEQLRQILPTIPTYVPGNLSESKMVKSLYDILHGGVRKPRLVIIHDLMTHGPFSYDENGALTDHAGSFDLMDYYPQHVFSAKVLLGMIDMILEADPDAVIVIQADHGVRAAEEAAKAAFGEDADTVELCNSTMSAIRVPEKYQTGEEHYTMENPLNLSRYLVNSFVGKNYEYLPPN